MGQDFCLEKIPSGVFSSPTEELLTLHPLLFILPLKNAPVLRKGITVF